MRFAIVFLFIFFVLQFSYSASRGSLVEHVVIDIATVQPGTAIINFISPVTHAAASGHRIVSSTASLSILNGCEGMEMIFLLMAAILAFKATWRHKLYGAMAGIVLVYLLNQARIVALFFATQHHQKWFALLHGYIAPTLILVLSSLYFLWWVSAAQRHEVTR